MEAVVERCRATPPRNTAVVERYRAGAGRDIEEVPSYLLRRRSALVAASLGSMEMDAHRDLI